MKKLSNIHLTMLAYIKKNPTASQVQIGKIVGIESRALMSYHIKELMLKGHLKKVNKWIVR